MACPYHHLADTEHQRYVIGASAWCPNGHCFPAIYAQDTYKDQVKATPLPAKHDRETHKLTGALQFVAKGLEVWSIIIATWLV